MYQGKGLRRIKKAKEKDLEKIRKPSDHSVDLTSVRKTDKEGNSERKRLGLQRSSKKHSSMSMGSLGP